MNILFLAPYVPSRIRVRPYQLIKELARNHSITVVALGEAGSTPAAGAEELSRLVDAMMVVPHSGWRGMLNSLMALPSREPMCAAYCRSGKMRAAVRDAIHRGGFDLVHVEHLRACHAAPFEAGLPMVFDSVDCLTGLFSQMARAKRNPISRLVMLEEAWKLRRYEPRMLGRFGRVVITSDAEREVLLRLGGSLQVDTVPNGVDTDYFFPSGAAKVPRRIIFSGKMSYSPNAQAAQWFAEEVFPAIRSKWDDAEFIIAGSGPPPSIRKLADNPGIRVTGYVDDLRPYLDSSVVAVAPMITAVGVQNKVLEAMAMALPVVASPLAVRAIGAGTPGLIEAESRDEVLERVVHLLDSPSSALEAGRSGRQVVVRDYSWQATARILERIYEQLLERGSP